MEIALAALGALALGVAVGFGIRRSMAARDVASAETRARKLVIDAQAEAEEHVRNALVEVKEEIAAMRREADEDVRTRREEARRREARLTKREEGLDTKIAELDRSGRALADKGAKLDRMRQELARAQEEEQRHLEHVARMTAQEAKDALIGQLTDQAKRDAMGTVREIEQRAREEAEARARKIVTIAIQRVASDQTAESTVSVFALPSDDLKGRIIGREGRNIRAFEAVTGVNLIIDDTPEAVVLSSFDPVRREVARLTLDKLVQDGRIHPARIEEMFERSSKEVEEQVKRSGEWAVGEVGITEIHPEMVRVLG
ncbi:MAG: Rnase Y domain-containing protein, partial [Actinomycetota bacterium]